MTPFLVLLVLALIQGLTEFLPVSSSGHLVLGRALLPGGDVLAANGSVEIWLHLGTLLAVVAYYRRELRTLVLGVLGLGPDAAAERRLALLLVVASVPAAVVGVGFEHELTAAFADPEIAAAALVATGLVLWTSRRLPLTGHDLRHVPFQAALVVGVAQSLAILPGISRSGATIVAGLAAGLSLEAAAAFSFLLAIPAILGAGLLEADALLEPGGPPLASILAAVAVSAVSGFLALGLLVRLGRSGRLWTFAPYCFTVGLFALLVLGLSD